MRQETKKIGKAQQIGVMDRGIPTEETLADLCPSDPPVVCLVGKCSKDG